jgi:uncharacterized membrane protein required for colicin V production
VNLEPYQAAGSLAWQLLFISFAVVLVLFEIVRGWNRGVARQAARLVALIAAYFAALLGGRFFGSLLRPLFHLPDRVVSILAGALLALLTYALINCAGRFLFKRTRQHEPGVARICCGLGGAILGVFFGAFLLWVVVFGVRSLGSIADAQVRQEAASGKNIDSTRTLHAVDVRRRLTGEIDTDQPATLVSSLARLKNSLELGSVGELIKRTDVIPEQTYATLEKVGQMVSNPESIQRFFEYPGAKELSQNPRIVALRNDPQIAELIEQGRYFDLLQNQRIIDVLNDRALVDQIKRFDLQGALDYATKTGQR